MTEEEKQKLIATMNDISRFCKEAYREPIKTYEMRVYEMGHDLKVREEG